MTAQPSNLAAALAAVQANLPAIVKGETATVPTKAGGKYSYSYADLADVSQVILPLLGKNGLAWITKPTFNADGKFVLAYKLRHVSGDEETGEYPLTGGTPQEIGSAITYARRYALCAVTGVAPAADDDDGAAATRSAQQARQDGARPARPDPEVARQNILTNALAAIVAAPLGGLPAIEERIDQYVTLGTLDAQDVLGLRQAVEARRAALLPAEDHTAEQPDDACPKCGRLHFPWCEPHNRPAEQPAMDADWPEPARPGGGDPA